MLTQGALALTPNEHRTMQSFAEQLMMRLQGTIAIDLSNPAGTQLSFGVKGREFFTDTQFDWELRKWMNLPTGEVIVAPEEHSMNGRLVCDMAIGGIGRLSSPIEVTVKNGVAQTVSPSSTQISKQVQDTLNTDEWSKQVGEFAFGINPQAKMVSEFIECEKILGTTHIAFGHNLDMPGGRNASANHMDLLISHPNVTVRKADGSAITILEEGKFTP
jgi:leucyl aminopeptidase (aminopeptidase T)